MSFVDKNNSYQNEFISDTYFFFSYQDLSGAVSHTYKSAMQTKNAQFFSYAIEIFSIFVTINQI